MGLTASERYANRASLRSNVKVADTTAPQGMGTTTAQLSNPNASSVVNNQSAPGGNVAAAQLSAPAWAQPVPILLGGAALLFAYKYLEEHPQAGTESVAGLKISIGNGAKVTILAVIGINIGKMIFTKWPVPGVGTLFLAA